MSKIAHSMFVLALLATPFAAYGDHWMDESYAEIAYEGSETISLLTVPNGTGNQFNEVRQADGTIVNATITLYLLDFYYQPVPDFPLEDIWLQTTDDGMVMCSGNTNPDYDTDANGETTWVNPLHAGGYSTGLIQVVVNGSPLTSSPGFNLNTNSPDINGDLVVNLSDLGLLANDLSSGYAYRSDFYYDGILNLSDIGKFATSVGAECP